MTNNKASHWDKSLLKIGVIALILSTTVLPDGSFANVRLKIILFFCCIAALFGCWLRGAIINRAYILLTILSLVFVTFFSLVGSAYAEVPVYYIFAEGVSFVSTISTVFVILMAVSASAIKDEEVVLTIFYGLLIFTIWKFLALVLLYTRLVSVGAFLSFSENYLRSTPVNFELPGGFHRIAYSAQDFAAVVFLFLLQAYPKIFSSVPRFLRCLFMFTGVIAVVSDYSRYYFIILAMLWFYLFLFKLSFKQRFVACFIVALLLTTSLPWVIEAYEYRFKSAMTAGSDITRVMQVSALLDAWENSPVLGGGIGFYTKNIVRSMYFYEVQWVSFLAKTGIVGIIYLIILVFLLFYKIFSGKRSFDHYILAFILLCFILSGFTNPLLLGAMSSIIYVLPLLIASILRKELEDRVSIISDE